MTDAAFRLDGQVALVTGAAAGIGRAIAEIFAAAGAAVAVTGLDAAKAQAAADGVARTKVREGRKSSFRPPRSG